MTDNTNGSPHNHDHGHTHGQASVDRALEASREGMRALKISMAGLAGTALLQAGVVVASGSVALLSDTLHNLSDAGTALLERATTSVTEIDFGLSGLTAEEEIQLTELLGRVRRALGPDAAPAWAASIPRSRRGVSRRLIRAIMGE